MDSSGSIDFGVEIKLQAKSFLDSLVAAVNDLAGETVTELSQFVADPKVQAQAAEFLRTSDQEHLAVIGFKLRTFARTKNLRAIQVVEAQIQQGVVFAGKMLATLISAAI